MNKLLYILILSVSLNAGNGIEEYIKNILAGYVKYDYELVSKPIGIESINDEHLKIDNSKGYRINGKYLYLPVLVSVNGIEKSSYLTLSVQLYQEVFVAVKEIKRDEKLTPEMFKQELKEVSKIRIEPVHDLFNITEYRSKVNIEAGEVLTKNLIEGNPIVHAGEIISAYSEYENLSITFQVKARDNGVFGEKIRVVRDDNKIFIAEVIDSKNVKIIE